MMKNARKGKRNRYALIVWSRLMSAFPLNRLIAAPYCTRPSDLLKVDVHTIGRKGTAPGFPPWGSPIIAVKI
jgi:hypothetical protein